jgi:hypothetical protein
MREGHCLQDLDLLRSPKGERQWGGSLSLMSRKEVWFQSAENERGQAQRTHDHVLNIGICSTQQDKMK